MLRHRSSAIALSVTLISLFCLHADKAAGDPLQGNVEKRDEPVELKPLAPTRTLQGGVKDDAALKNSLKLIPASLDKRKDMLPGGASHNFGRPDGQVEQYQGNVNKTDNPIRDPRPARAGLVTQTPHVIPPVTTYFPTPSNGIMIWDTEYGVKAVPLKETNTFNVPGHESNSITTHSGVTTYDSDFATGDARVTTSSAIHIPGQESSITTTRDGVTVYEPGFEVGEIPAVRGPSVVGFTARSTTTSITPGQDFTAGTTREGITSYVPGFEVLPSASQHGISTYDPGYQVSISTTRDGIVCWQSGYQAYEMSPGLRKETLGGMYYTRDSHGLPEGLRATPEQLVLNRVPIFVQPEVMPMQRPLVATGLLLPQLRLTSGDKDLTWKKWYDKMGEAIYSRWQYADVVAGIAHVRIEVTRDRNIEAQVVGFDPAPYAAKPEVEAQKAFCQAAVGAVNRVTQFEVPQFPASAADIQRVTIYVDMKRAVDSAAGFTVAASPKASKNSEPAAALEPQKGP